MVCSIDVGTRNPARTLLEIRGEHLRVLSVDKLDWSTDWEYRVARDVCAVRADVVLVEKQGPRSPYAKFLHFMRGLLFGQTPVLCCNPARRQLPRAQAPLGTTFPASPELLWHRHSRTTSAQQA